MAKKIIKAQMKQRQDTKANWAAVNPVLLDGELGMVSNDHNLYKVGDGRTAWNDLPFRGFDGTLAQELGTSPNAAISQKAVTEKLAELRAKVLDFTIYEINNAIEKNGGVIDRVINQTPIINALKNNTLIVIPIGAYSDGYCVVQGELDGTGTLAIEFDYSGFHYSAYIESEVIETDKEKIGSNIVIDEELSSTSTNPVQNKVIESKLSSVSAENERLKERIEEQDIFIADLQNMKIDKVADDYYPQLSVGVADNLAGVDEVDSNFSFRRSGGGAIADGVARVQSIKGNSIVWNQLVGIEGQDNSKSANGVTITDNRDGTYSVVTTSQGASANTFIQVGSGKATIANHRYVLYGGAQGGAYSTYQLYATNGFPSQLDDFGNGTFGTAQGGDTYLVLMVWKGCVINTPIRFEPKFTDLTKMFGEGNEPTTIAEFYSRIPMGVDLNAYNEGEVIDMKVQGIKSVGRNAWDGVLADGYINIANGQIVSATSYRRSANPIKVMPSSSYYIKATSARILFYDKDDAFIGYQTMSGGAPGVFTTPSNASFVRFFVDKAYVTNDICINLSDTEFNGQYEPYIEATEDFSIVAKYFPNGMRSAGSAHDELRYNKQTNRFNAMQRIKVVWLKDLDWGYASAQGYFYSIGNIYAIEGSTMQCRLLCNAYDASSWSKFVLNYAGAKQNMIAVYTNAVTGETRLNVLESRYTDVATFKASLEGVFAYIESSEPIVTEIEEKDFNLDYSVWNCGTEQAIAEGKSSALAADITYGFNAIGKIKELESLVAALRAKVGI